MTKILVAQLGARKHYQEPALFHDWKVLDSLYTDFYIGCFPFDKLIRRKELYKIYPNFLKKAVDRYSYKLEGSSIIHFPLFGIKYTNAMRNVKSQNKSEMVTKYAKKFCEMIISNGLHDVDTVYGFDGACLELFKYAQSKSIRCVLDQTVAERDLIYKLLLEEERLWEGWSNEPFTVSKADLAYAERQKKEHQLADRIVCGSSFVKQSLIDKGIDESKISVVSLGNIKVSQQNQKSKISSNASSSERHLNILFAGTIELRKGIQYLLQALKLIKQEHNISFTCRAAGKININQEIIDEYSDVCNFLGLIPRRQMKELYKWADVFVLPSICEGSAMVIYEALSYRLPVITTFNSGSIVRDGVDGFVLNIRDVEGIVRCLRSVYSTPDFGFDKYQDFLDYWQKNNEESINKLKRSVLN